MWRSREEGPLFESRSGTPPRVEKNFCWASEMGITERSPGVLYSALLVWNHTNKYKKYIYSTSYSRLKIF